MKMKKIMPAISIFLIIVFGLFISSESVAQGKHGLKVLIQPQNVMLDIGEEIQFDARLVDKDGSEIDTTFTWSVDATGFGTITNEGIFTALNYGHGFVYGSAGDLVGKAHIKVIDPAMCDSTGLRWNHLEILPQDTLILVGESTQFHAYLIDSSGIRHDTTANWEIRGHQVGTITDQGLFTATEKGIGLIRGTLGRYMAMTKILVSTTEDSASADSVRIRFRDRNGKQYGHSYRSVENNVFKIHGLPFPFNLLNGGEIVFSPGSMSEDIVIEIGLPGNAQVEADSTITFTEQILNGIAFHVYVNGTLVSPYYFNKPVELILPFKEDLLNALGLVAEDLWIFFYSDSAGYDSNGITNVVVDTSRNKIYAEVIHFSDLVITSKEYSGSTGIQTNLVIPSQYQLLSNYPNPFNPETTIRFELIGKTEQRVTLTIYNLLGQEIRTLFEGNCEPGTHSVKWDGKDENGRSLGSGIFIYHLKGEKISLNRRMVLIR